MEFSSIPVPRSLVLLLQVIDFFYFAGEVFFFYVGIASEMPIAPWEGSVLAENIPSLPRLTVVRYESLLKNSSRDREHICVVCMVELEYRDEVRELGNCSHVFHKGCIDRWVDIGQRTCPLCRSQLAPVERKGWLLTSVTKLS